jgi:hypothetical protein
MQRMELVEFTKWDDLYRFYRDRFATKTIPAEGRGLKDPLWVFRGQADHGWKLKTKLEREFERAKVPKEKYGYFEEGLIREFQRRLQAAEERATVPSVDNVLGWLALMQHHGAPTRLLDWSYSFFVALFFAVEAASSDAAVYAIDARWCNEQARSKLPNPSATALAVSRDPYITKSATFKNLFARRPETPFVYRINTFSLNTRLAVQQGIFLCPGTITSTFQENLGALFTVDQATPVFYKLIIKMSVCSEILDELSFMNIGRHSLFPGIDGFAQSIHQFLMHSDRLFPPWRQKQQSCPFENWSEWEAWDERADSEENRD